MNNLIIKSELANNIILLGIQNKESIAEEMQKATAFIHNSNFETFSVVCAEALCCGTPVIVSKLTAIQEYLRDGIDGIFVEKNNIYEWKKSIEYFLERKTTFDHQEIAARSSSLFSKKTIGQKYISLLQNSLDENSD